MKKDVEIALQLAATQGTELDNIAKDPLIDRFFEIVYVYGDTIKAIIYGMFGDGIMSAIDFDRCGCFRSRSGNGYPHSFEAASAAVSASASF
jgi:Cyanate lyase C-terminal domain